MQQPALTPQQALQKIKHYCAYQERCHSEVKEKLYGYGLNSREVEAIITQLIEEDYLNELRFAEQFAGGRFRLKQWGRVRIRYELKQRQVSDYCIKKGLQAIDADAYERTLQRLAEQKLNELRRETNMAVKRKKLQAYLLQKGYEPDNVREVLRRLLP
ncbi:MAG: regulatory protein RecX [Lacibacter sp.]